MFNSISLSYNHHYDSDELRNFRTSSVASEAVTVNLDSDFTWPAHVEAFLRFLTQCGYIISEDNINKIVEVCDNCIEHFEEKKCEDT